MLITSMILFYNEYAHGSRIYLESLLRTEAASVGASPCQRDRASRAAPARIDLQTLLRLLPSIHILRYGHNKIKYKHPKL